MRHAASVCPGCGLAMPAGGRRFDDIPTASPECWDLYGEVSARVLNDANLQRFQQLRVDTYLAQHPGPEMSDLSIAFGLIGLHLALDRGATGPEVRAVHQRLGNARIAWPHIAAPDDRGPVTVRDVARAATPDRFAQELRRWAESVWAAWAPQHATVHGWLRRVRL